MAAYRRYVRRPERLTQASRFGVTLGLLSFIVLMGWVIESLRLAIAVRLDAREKHDEKVGKLRIGFDTLANWNAAFVTQDDIE